MGAERAQNLLPAKRCRFVGSNAIPLVDLKEAHAFSAAKAAQGFEERVDFLRACHDFQHVAVGRFLEWVCLESLFQALRYSSAPMIWNGDPVGEPEFRCRFLPQWGHVCRLRTEGYT